MAPTVPCAAVRLATWNVNSLNARLPPGRGVAGRGAARRRLHAGDEAAPTTPSRPWPSRRSATSRCHHGEGRWNGVAILSRVGHRRRRRRLRRRRRPRRRGPPADRPPAAASASSRAYVPNGRAPRRTSTTSTSSLARPAAGAPRPTAATRPRPGRALRRLQHRARRPRRLRPGRVYVGATHVSAPERAALGGVARLGARRRLPRSATRPAACSRGGTTGPATSTRASACASTSCSPRRRWPSGPRPVAHRPQRPQGQEARRTTRRVVVDFA